MIQVVSSDHFVLDALVVVLDAVVGIIAFEDEQVLHRELLVLVPSDLEALLLTRLFDLGRVQQIKDLFVVDLEERARDRDVLVPHLRDLVKSLSNGPQGKPIVEVVLWNLDLTSPRVWIIEHLWPFVLIALHCECLAATSLTISEYGGVIAIYHF